MRETSAIVFAHLFVERPVSTAAICAQDITNIGIGTVTLTETKTKTGAKTGRLHAAARFAVNAAERSSTSSSRG